MQRSLFIGNTSIDKSEQNRDINFYKYTTVTIKVKGSFKLKNK